MTSFDFDLFVIGAGSGGVRAARIAAGYGAKVGIAEEYRVGGTCVIRGCVPKKLLVYASRFHDEFEDARGFGWSLDAAPRFDWPTLIAAKDREITRLEGLYRANLDKAGVQIFASRARLDGPNTIALAKPGSSGATKITAAKILIATGGRPERGAAIEGLDLAITSNEAFDLKRLPERVLINGGGYIALEFAGIFAGLGAKTTVVYRGEKVLRGFDDDLRDGLTHEYAQRGIEIITQRTIRRLTKGSSSGTAVIAELSDGQPREVDCVMYATGRVPLVADLGLELAGVELGHNGGIRVDRASRTSVAHIFAVGDVTNRINLTPVAIREGHAFADREFGDKTVATGYDMVPSAVFSTPEIGTVGLSEADARDPARIAALHPGLAGQLAAQTQGGANELDIYKAQFRPMKGTLSGRSERMLMKLVVHRQSGRVLGCHVLGPDAAEIVQMAAIAMRMGATKADFDATMALHPSAAEELVTMRTKWTPQS